jgi:hypothetical protein
MQLADVHAAFSKPADDARPMMRWWWFGPDANHSDTDRQLQAMADAGIGGVEVAYVYPLWVDSIDFLSAAFLDELRYAAERAHDLGLRFDLTLTSGWPFGGPHISDEHVSRGIVWERRSVLPGAHRIRTAAQWPGDRLVAAAIAPGDIHEPLHDVERLAIRIDPDIDPDRHADGDTASVEIVVPAGTGPRQIVLGFIRPTGQVVKRAAAGAEGPALDHYSADATLAHLDRVGGALLEAVPADLIGSFFCDSLEVYGANWTADLPDEFARRRGYDLMDKLHLLVSTDDEARTFRADFHRTLTEMFEERFVAVCAQWCHERGVPFRIQSYGVPPARPSSYRFADRYEGEGWGWKTLTSTRWASSAAHIDGVNIVSAEAWTWVHSPSFRATPLDLKGEAHEHFLCGVNHLIGHGWPYSPADADGLGWFFYAAGALDDRNAWWPAMPQLMSYLRRASALLRLGDPVRDVLVYLPVDDLYAELGDNLDLFKAAQSRLPAELFTAIREHGRDFDVFDDAMTDRIAPEDAGTVIVASARSVGATTARWLHRVMGAGGSVIAIDSPDAGGRATTIADLPDVLDEVSAPLSRLSEPSPAIGIVRRAGATTDIHFAFNTSANIQHASWSSTGERAYVEVWNPETGAILQRRNTTENVTISVEPYSAVVVVETDEPSPVPSVAPPSEGALRTLRPLGGGTVLFSAKTGQFFGQDARRVTLPHCWEDDPELAEFSGTAHYALEFDLPTDPADWPAQVTLRLGSPTPWSAAQVATEYRPNSYRVLLDPPVGEVADVSVNGDPVGIVWAPPYALDVRSHVRPGRNTVELAVSNTTAAALASDTASAARTVKVRAEYGERFVNQDIGRARDGVRSGLLCVPTLELR